MLADLKVLDLLDNPIAVSDLRPLTPLTQLSDLYLFSYAPSKTLLKYLQQLRGKYNNSLFRLENTLSRKQYLLQESLYPLNALKSLKCFTVN